MHFPLQLTVVTRFDLKTHLELKYSKLISGVLRQSQLRLAIGSHSSVLVHVQALQRRQDDVSMDMSWRRMVENCAAASTCWCAGKTAE
jgi:hypothetical protein